MLETSHANLLNRLNLDAAEDQEGLSRNEVPTAAATAAILKEQDKLRAISMSKATVYVKHGIQGSKQVVSSGISLRERMESFSAIVECEQKRISKYQTEYDNVTQEIKQLAVEIDFAEGAPTVEQSGLSLAPLHSALSKQVSTLEGEIDSLGGSVLAKLEKQRKKEVLMKKELARFLESKFAEYDDL
jgi:predicted component of viral defense system (DUF524 family)